MKTAPVFEMRGLCYGTSFDKHFGWTGTWEPETEQYTFRGFSKSIINWHDEKKEWRLTLYQDKTIYGICNETNEFYPFGTYNWYFFNDTCPRDEPIQGKATFKFQISFSGEWYLNQTIFYKSEQMYKYLTSSFSYIFYGCVTFP